MSALHPMAYRREAERLVTLARIAAADNDTRRAMRYQAQARRMQRRATQGEA